MGLRGIPRPGTRRLDSGEGQANGKHRWPRLIILQTKGTARGGVAPPLVAAHVLAHSRLQRRHPFAEEPKGFVEFDIQIDAVHGAGLHTARPAEIVAAHAMQPAFDGVFLNHVPHGPEIIGAVVVPAGNK